MEEKEINPFEEDRTEQMDAGAVGSEKTEMRKQMNRIGVIFLIFAGASLGLQILMSALEQAFFPQLANNTALELLVLMLPVYCIATPLCFALMNLLPKKTTEKKRMKFGSFLTVLIMGFSCMYLGNFIGMAVTAVIGAAKGSSVNNDLVSLVMGMELWGTILVAVIIAPIVEEFVFRKLLVDHVVTYGEGTAVVLSGLMFGLFHGNLNQFFYAFLIGMLFAYVYCKTGRVIYTMILHVIINFCGSIVPVVIMRVVDLDAISALEQFTPDQSEALAEQITKLLPSLLIYGGYVILLIGLIIAGVVLFALKRRKFVLLPGETAMTTREKRAVVCTSVGMILYAIFWIGMMVFQMLQ